jgi:hypothetical protein
MAECHQELLLDLNADCAEFCTTQRHHHWLSVGTYQLDEASSTRHGRLYLYSLQQQQQQQQPEQDRLRQPQLQQIATLDVPGIFDLQWTHLPAASAAPCMGLALADGTLRLVTVQSAAAQLSAQDQQQQLADVPNVPACEQQMQPTAAAVLQEVFSCQAVASGMALALDWSWQQQQQPHLQQQQQQLLGAVSSSAGTISIVQVRQGHAQGSPGCT